MTQKAINGVGEKDKIIHTNDAPLPQMPTTSRKGLENKMQI